MNTEWISLSKLAAEYDKNRATIFRWFQEGFLLKLGYHMLRDAKGRLYVSKTPESPETPDRLS